ncbi:hypothetical protein AXX12_11705 [Anaerosporomusa subterranea]|uniref:Indole-3-glycerol phosphate synthase n=1 Tax=Anaerosporomusa subterranea TaxID=1794912 RepID=A0A154BPE7_ANASB|nr:indole-3-glycerol phosphate synthase TrpC [Anaerosporomusa subterranea]KYZ75854.1 hypothetical protein AXX12_11705 [Anaerosporomusa subterranea]
MILEKILASVRHDLELRKQNQPQAVLDKQMKHLPATCGFRKALAIPGQVQIIAEFKQASPSKGIIRQDLTPEAVISAYADNGAAAISVLTEPQFFKGNVSYLSQARKITNIPLLRKDFIIDEYQLIEARVYGADAVLLIVAALGQQRLTYLLQQAQELSLDCLVEAHTKAEIEVALASGAQIIGINNRNLGTFETRLETTFELAKYIPPDRILISESGINTKADIANLATCGVNAVLVGEALMRSPSPGQKLRELAGDRH